MLELEKWLKLCPLFLESLRQLHKHNISFLFNFWTNWEVAHSSKLDFKISASYLIQLIFKNMILLRPSEFHNLNHRINYRLNHLARSNLKKMEPVLGEQNRLHVPYRQLLPRSRGQERATLRILNFCIQSHQSNGWFLFHTWLCYTNGYLSTWKGIWGVKKHSPPQHLPSK